MDFITDYGPFIIGIFLFALLVLLHEFGHFIVARRNGVEVEEFGFGFPPRIFSKQVGNTVYSFNLLPLGGFVKQKGETDGDSRPGTFGSKGLWVKTKILLAGVGMNVLAAMAIIFVLALIQLPTLTQAQYRVPADQTIVAQDVLLQRVEDGSPAADAGLRSGDVITKLNGKEVTSARQLSTRTQAIAGEEATVTFGRDGARETTSVQLRQGADVAELGVAPIDREISRYTWAAPLVAVGTVVHMAAGMLSGLWEVIYELVTGAGQEAARNVAGPVGIVVLLENISSFGFSYLFFFIALISTALAVFNTLPIPALDGGRLAVIAAARASRKQLTEKVENSIHGVGFVALLALIALVTYVDIQRFF
ncbi:hypothetical protein BRC19_03610 [Candidatus Saccharibacteria bacterium QS_5_54_17]|nr:MAG: hypothetical protein BRC19_03610 [Candidatus Saccharibacteria bacterium QS_5_54_17]